MSVKDTEKEKWIKIKNYPKYMISNLGRVWSEYTKKYIKPHLRSKDKGKAYLKVSLYNIDGTKTFSMHRLLAETFIPNPDNKCCINHKDGNKTNNHLANLEWVTYSENTQHASDTKLMLRGTDRLNSKLTNDKVIEIANLLQTSDLSFNSIGRIYGVDSGVIRDIHRRHSWQHMTKGFIFADRESKIKLTEADVKQIANTFLTTSKNNSLIAEDYGVTGDQIGKIRRRVAHINVLKNIKGDFFKLIRESEVAKPSNTLLTKEQVKEICKRMSKEKPNFSAIAREYGLKHDDAIRMIYHKQTWKDVSKDYTFKETARKKITEEIVHNIIWYFINTSLNNSEIAKKLNINKDTVRYIRNRKSWAKIINSVYSDIDFKKNI